MVDRKAGLVYVVDDVPSDGDTVTWDAALRQWVPRAGGSGGLSGDYAAALGKVELVGAFSKPTFFDPAAVDWAAVVADNHAWVQFDYAQNFHKEIDFTLGTGDGSTGPLLNVFVHPQDAAINLVDANFSYGLLADVGLTRAEFVFTGAPDQTPARVVTVQAGAGQTSAMLGVLDEDGTAVLDVSQEAGGGGQIGFFGAAPVTQRTGVAVDAAGIHAALVSLGLITA